MLNPSEQSGVGRRVVEVDLYRRFGDLAVRFDLLHAAARGEERFGVILLWARQRLEIDHALDALLEEGGLVEFEGVVAFGGLAGLVFYGVAVRLFHLDLRGQAVRRAEGVTNDTSRRVDLRFRQTLSVVVLLVRSRSRPTPTCHRVSPLEHQYLLLIPRQVVDDLLFEPVLRLKFDRIGVQARVDSKLPLPAQLVVLHCAVETALLARCTQLAES